MCMHYHSHRASCRRCFTRLPSPVALALEPLAHVMRPGPLCSVEYTEFIWGVAMLFDGSMAQRFDELWRSIDEDGSGSLNKSEVFEMLVTGGAVKEKKVVQLCAAACNCVQLTMVTMMMMPWWRDEGGGCHGGAHLPEAGPGHVLLPGLRGERPSPSVHCRPATLSDEACLSAGVPAWAAGG